MLNIQTRIQTDMNPSKRIRSRIRSENIRTIFISEYLVLANSAQYLVLAWLGELNRPLIDHTTHTTDVSVHHYCYIYKDLAHFTLPALHQQRSSTSTQPAVNILLLDVLGF
jgi:hypothetical protein